MYRAWQNDVHEMQVLTRGHFTAEVVFVALLIKIDDEIETIKNATDALSFWDRLKRLT